MLHALKSADQLTELHTLVRKIGRELQRTLGCTDHLGTDRSGSTILQVLDRRPGRARRSQQGVRRDPDAIEVQTPHSAGEIHRAVRLDIEPFGRALDDGQREIFVTAAGPKRDHEDVRVLGVHDEEFLAVEREIVPVGPSLERDAGGIETSLVARDRDRTDP